MDGITVTLEKGERLLDRALSAGIALPHECGGVLACASCCVIVREGEQALSPASDDELDMLERAGAAAPGARLACQASALVDRAELDIEVREPPAPVTASHEVLPVSLTESAARHFARQLAQHANAVGVRLGVAAAGCSGLSYRVDPAYEIGAGDTVFESRGIRIVVDRESLARVHGTVLDVVEEGLARRVRFDNPNARESCGCGKSFS
jgi:iron-sulfur cluster assembly protein